MLITDRNLQRAAIVFAAGYHVEIFKLPTSPRCAAEYVDSPEIRALIEAFDSKKIIDIPHKVVLDCYGQLMARAKDLKVGRVGGV